MSKLSNVFASYVVRTEMSGGNQNNGDGWATMERYVLTTDEMPDEFGVLESESIDGAETYVESSHSCESSAYTALLEAEGIGW